MLRSGRNLTAEYAYTQRNSLHLVITAPCLVWATFLWRQWRGQRATMFPRPIRSLGEIVMSEHRAVADSLFLLSPFLAVCTVWLGYLQRGQDGAYVGLVAGVVYLLFVWAIHRYPAAPPN
jgi:hypothetical protein